MIKGPLPGLCSPSSAVGKILIFDGEFPASPVHTTLGWWVTKGYFARPGDSASGQIIPICLGVSAWRRASIDQSMNCPCRPRLPGSGVDGRYAYLSAREGLAKMGGSTGAACIRCRSTELDRYGEGQRCLDCGARFQISPGGTPVRSLRTWWLLTAANAVIGILSIVIVAAYLSVGRPGVGPIVALWGLLAVLVDGGRIRAAVANIR